MSLPGISCGIAYKGGGSNAVVLNTTTVAAVGEVRWKIDADGYVYTYKNAVYSQRYQWTADSAAAYEVRATILDGGVDTGTTGSWLAITVDREWTITVPDKYALMTMEVRDVATSTVRATCSVILSYWTL